MNISKDWHCLFLIKTVEKIHFHMWLVKSKLVQSFCKAIWQYELNAIRIRDLYPAILFPGVYPK